MYRFSRSASMIATRNDAGLDNDAIARVAPSVLTAEGHADHLSERYVAIPTVDMIDGLRAEGFLPVEARQNRVRLANKREFARHLVRLRHADAPTDGDNTPEFLLLNSHDGSSSYQMLAGRFRFVCSNGLISGDVTTHVRIQHRRDAVQRAQEEALRLIERVREGSQRIEAMRARILAPIEQSALAASAASIRWGESVPLLSTDALLTPRRYGDRKADLWSVFNRVQENVIRGGVAMKTTTGRVQRARAVTGIDEDVRINRELWNVADAISVG